MCERKQALGVAGALAALDRALAELATADVGSLTVAEQAEALRVLERAEAQQTVARGRVLSMFTAQRGCEADGQGSARAWLRWQTRITRSAAADAVAWGKRLDAHPAIAAALAAGHLSASWARRCATGPTGCPGNPVMTRMRSSAPLPVTA